MMYLIDVLASYQTEYIKRGIFNMSQPRIELCIKLKRIAKLVNINPTLAIRLLYTIMTDPKYDTYGCEIEKALFYKSTINSFDFNINLNNLNTITYLVERCELHYILTDNQTYVNYDYIDTFLTDSHHLNAYTSDYNYVINFMELYNRTELFSLEHDNISDICKFYECGINIHYIQSCYTDKFDYGGTITINNSVNKFYATIEMSGEIQFKIDDNVNIKVSIWCENYNITLLTASIYNSVEICFNVTPKQLLNMCYAIYMNAYNINTEYAENIRFYIESKYLILRNNSISDLNGCISSTMDDGKLIFIQIL